MCMICPYCDMEISETAFDHENGCCPECGATITPADVLGNDNEDDLDEMDSIEDDDSYDSADDLDELGDFDDIEDLDDEDFDDDMDYDNN